MAAPLRTAGQFLLESGFGQTRETLSFPEYPELDAQLHALRKLDPRAREISWIEYTLGRAREARLVDDEPREAAELAAARKSIEDSFKRRTTPALWGKLAALLAIIGLVGLLVWLQQRKKKRLSRRRQNLPHLEHATEDEEEEDDEPDDDEEAEDDD